MNVQSAANLNIPEGGVRNIHDKNNQLLWSAVGYDVTYRGDTTQQTYSGKNKILIPSGTKTDNGIIWVRENGGAHGTGTLETQTYSNFVGTTTLSLPAGDYTFSIKEALPSPLRVEFSTRDNDNVRKNYQIPAGQTSITKNFPNGLSWTGIALVGGTIGTTYDVTISDIQIEAGSTATDYEPYVGGIPAPNPDYPQDVNVVKGAQSVKMTGKNLWKFASSYSNTKSSASWVLSDSVISLPAGTYTFSCTSNATTEKNRINYKYADGVAHTEWFKDKLTLTFTEDLNKIALNLGASTYANDIQLEFGSTTTFYEQYQGQTFPMDLGSIELCKIGNYQDYIYKNGDDWYVYKETGKVVLDGDENVYVAGTQISGNNRFFVDGPDDMITNTDTEIKGFLYSDMFIELTNAQSFAGTTQGMLVRANGSKQFAINYYGVTTGSQFKTWISTNNVTVYYALGTPTYTKITDNTLIGQLNAVHDWLRRYDYYGVVSGNLPIIINRSGII